MAELFALHRVASLSRAIVATSAMYAATFASCTERVSEAKAFASPAFATSFTVNGPTDARVVLVTIDGARWQDVFTGTEASRSGLPYERPEVLMPRTYGLLSTRGVAFGADGDGCGVVHTASGSNVSLPGYQEIFTGRPSWCLDNDCDQVTDSVVDEAAAAGVRGVASIGSWNVLDRAVSAGAAGVFVAAGRRWPGLPAAPRGAPKWSPRADEDVLAAGDPSGATDAFGATVAARAKHAAAELHAIDAAGAAAAIDALGVASETADPFPGSGDYRPDAATSALALAYYRAYRPAFFHLGLGDTDEWGHRNDYPRYLEALRAADAVIGELADAIDAMGEVGKRTTIIVTPDHGRNSDFINHGTLRVESGRTFVMLFGARVRLRGVACSPVDITLADIAPTIRAVLGLGRDTGPGAGRPIDVFATDS